MGLIFDRGDSGPDPDAQRQQQVHMQNLSQSLPNDGLDPAYVDKVTNSQLEQGTINLLSNMLSPDWVLSNFNDAEVNEVRWLARIMQMQIESLHPNEKTVYQGEFRKYCADDSRQALKPLDSAQRAVIFQFIQGVIARAARSKDGWQQEIFKKQITESHTVDGSDGGDGGGWF